MKFIALAGTMLLLALGTATTALAADEQPVEDTPIWAQTGPLCVNGQAPPLSLQYSEHGTIYVSQQLLQIVLYYFGPVTYIGTDLGTDEFDIVSDASLLNPGYTTLAIGGCGKYVGAESHGYVCTLHPLAGEGAFAAVTTGQMNSVSTDPVAARFSLVLGNATPAFWSKSHGATCDNPAKWGETDQGYRVAGGAGVDVNSNTPYDLSLMGKVAPPQPFGSGVNNLYEFFA